MVCWVVLHFVSYHGLRILKYDIAMEVFSNRVVANLEGTQRNSND